MCTVLFLLGMIAWQLKMRRLDAVWQHDLVVLLTEIFVVIPRLGDLVIPLGRFRIPVINGFVHKHIAAFIFDHVGTYQYWADCQIRMPSLQYDDVPLAQFVWYVMRYAHVGRMPTRLLRNCLHVLAQKTDASLQRVLLHRIPFHPMPSSAKRLWELANRGADKRLLMLNTFLGKRTGTAAREINCLLSSISYTSAFQVYKQMMTKSVCATYFAKSREVANKDTDDRSCICFS
jgi:hypothetical protein